MLHRDREHSIVEVDSVDSLYALLTKQVWGLTTGFRLGRTLFLNDSIVEGSIQEFAVLRDGVQVESITLEGLDPAAACELLAVALEAAEPAASLRTFVREGVEGRERASEEVVAGDDPDGRVGGGLDQAVVGLVDAEFQG